MRFCHLSNTAGIPPSMLINEVKLKRSPCLTGGSCPQTREKDTERPLTFTLFTLKDEFVTKLTSFPMISALTIFAPMSLRSFSVIFFAGITTVLFSSASPSKLELLSVSDCGFISWPTLSFPTSCSSRGDDPLSVPCSSFFFHPPEGLELGLSLECLSLLLDSSFGSKSHVEDVTVEDDDGGRLNFPANDDLIETYQNLKRRTENCREELIFYCCYFIPSSWRDCAEKKQMQVRSFPTKTLKKLKDVVAVG